MLPHRAIDLGEFRGHRVLLVPVTDIALPRNLVGHAWRPGARNHHGYMYEDLANAVKHFGAHILPELLRGVSLEELAERGPGYHSDGSVDWTSLTQLIPSFFSAESGIVVSWGAGPDVDGRHRLQIARDLGISHVPVVVKGYALPAGLISLAVASPAGGRGGTETLLDGVTHMSEQTRVTPAELEDFARRFLARTRDIEDRLQSIRDGLRALGRTFDDTDFVRFQENFERSSRSISEFADFSGTEANRMLLMAEDARLKEQVAKGGA